MCNMAESLLTKQHRKFQDVNGLRIRSHHLSIITANGLDWVLLCLVSSSLLFWRVRGIRGSYSGRQGCSKHYQKTTGGEN